MSASSCHAAVGDADERKTLHQSRDDFGTTHPHRHEEPQLPADDLRHETERLEAVDHAVGEAGELDAMRAHDARAAELKPIFKDEHGAAILEDGPCFISRECWRVLRDGLRDPGG